MDIELLKNMLIEHEGYRKKPYLCTANKITIGIGHNLTDKGLSTTMIDRLFDEDLKDCAVDLAKVFGKQFTTLPIKIQYVLMDMMFNLGINRFYKFKKMIQAVKDNDWTEMIKQMIDSKWYRQVTNRADNLIRMIKEIELV